MNKNIMKVGKLATAALIASPILSTIGGTNVFAANQAGKGSGNTGTAVIPTESQSSAVAATVVGTGSAAGQSQAAIEFYAGQLSLDAVPNFDFGAHGLQDAAAYQLYSAAPVLTTDFKGVNNPTSPQDNNLSYYRVLQVTDKTASTSGWKVTAWAEPFQQQGGGATAVKMTPTDITLATEKIDRKQAVHDPDQPADPTAMIDQYSDGTSDPHAPNKIPSSSTAVKIPFGASVSTPATVWTATAGTGSDNVAYGKGTWAADFTEAGSATLNLPISEQTTIGTFVSTIHWSLQAGV